MLYPEKSPKAESKTRLCLVAGKEEESLLWRAKIETIAGCCPGIQHMGFFWLSALL